jgi:hypothetical protein
MVQTKGSLLPNSMRKEQSFCHESKTGSGTVVGYVAAFQLWGNCSTFNIQRPYVCPVPSQKSCTVVGCSQFVTHTVILPSHFIANHAIFGYIDTAPLSLSEKQVPFGSKRTSLPPQFVRRTQESIINDCIVHHIPMLRYAQLVFDEPRPRTTFSDLSERRWLGWEGIVIQAASRMVAILGQCPTSCAASTFSFPW